MISVDGYTIVKELKSYDKNKKFLAKRNKDGIKVTIKITGNPDRYISRKITEEFEILKILGTESPMEINELITGKDYAAIVTDYFEGDTLESLYSNKAAKLSDFFDIAIKITRLLDNIHKKNIIHKDINPVNITINRYNNELRITDYGIASRISREILTTINPNLLEGNLDYISPEQTGRMNRTIDYRTDYYSLGILFYRLLTGRLPFISDDPMEVIHYHIAKLPPEPFELNPEIPKAVSKIVMKLISKNAESRYQSAYGIMHDLEKCRDMFNNSDNMADFEPGMSDISEKLQIPEKLYGREKDIEFLKNILDVTVKGEKELIFIAGSAGIGKSALINELQKNVIENRVYFISGKYDQFKRNIPFSAMIEAFRGLIRQIISEADEKINEWKSAILNSIGQNGNVIIEVIPELELIIGKQPELPLLPALETQNRFNNVFEEFVKVFAKKNHPLILFLDDLQWLDNGSIKLLEILFSDIGLNYFMFIGAFRDNEILPEHSLNLFIDKMNKLGKMDIVYNLKPIGIDDIGELLSDTLHIEKNNTIELAVIINGKCGGNPFFINQFINSVHEKKLIQFDNGWCWDISRIKMMRVTENVIDLMTEKIKRFDDRTVEILKTASCIGMTFSIDMLSKISEWEEDKVTEKENSVNKERISSLLYDAINEGIIVKKDNGFKFIHDKVRESAYLLIGEQNRADLHYKTGFILLEEYQTTRNEDLIFDIVGHLILSKNLLHYNEKNIFSRLGLKAGLKAKLSTAYESSLNFIRHSMDLLDEKCWIKDYKFCLDIYSERAELEYLNNNFQNADHFFEIVLKNTKNELDNLRIYELKILSVAARLKLKEAIKYGIDVLRRYGIKLTKNPGQLSAFPDIMKASILIGKKDPMKLLNLPEMKDPYILAGVRILMTISPFCYLVYTEYVPLITMKLVNLSLKYGNCNSSAFGYSIYGFLKCGLFHDMENGYQFGQLALKLIDRYNDKFLKGEVNYILGAFIVHWTRHMKNAEPLLFEGYQSSSETGNKPYTGYNLDDYFSGKFVRGQNLFLLKDEFQKYISNMYKTQEESAILYLEAYRQVVLNLTELNSGKTRLSGVAYDEISDIPRLIEAENNVCLAAFYHVKIFLCFIYEKYEEGLEVYRKGKKAIKTAFSKYQEPEFYFYFSLIFFSHYELLSGRQKKSFLKEVKGYMKLFEMWVKYSPENFRHKLILLKAEYARISGRDEDAMRYYDEAVSLAGKSDYLNIESIANECAMKFYLSLNYKKPALSYLLEARFCYAKWGAIVKVNDMEMKYKTLFDSINKTNEIYGDIISKTVLFADKSKSLAWQGDPRYFDINTVIKSTLSVSGEFDMEKLLRKLLNLLIVNSGAQKCSLILINNDISYVEAEGDMNNNYYNILHSLPLENSGNIPKSVVRYVIKTQEEIILNDALKEGLFKNDEYIIKENSKSIMCIPINNQGKVIGAVYLENNAVPGVFTSNRIELVKMISFQAAISIENARLIIEIKEKERLKQEMEIAERIQTALIPVIPEDNELEISAYMKPAEEVGGDYYDVVYDGERKLWFAVGDVSGHGVTPGLIMMMAQTSFNNQLAEGRNLDPKGVLNSINRVLCSNVRQKLKESHFMTMTVLKYDGGGNFIFSGLHLDIIVYRKKTGMIERVRTEGVYLSVMQDISGKLKNAPLHLDIDDIMVLYTDGIIESRNRDDRKQLWGIDRLCKAVKDNAGDIESMKKNIVDEILKWCGNKLDDDITLLFIHRTI